MPTHDPQILLGHMRECCRRLIECAALREREDQTQAILLDAACRNLEILGEASTRFVPEFRDAHPEIPWRKMIGARNILIHAYEGTDPTTVWDIVDRDIPPLLAAILRLLGKPARTPSSPASLVRAPSPLLTGGTRPSRIKS
jgi:uncharacterized protein with HEPN domain